MQFWVERPRGDIQEPVADGIGRLAVMKVHRKYFWG